MECGVWSVKFAVRSEHMSAVKAMLPMVASAQVEPLTSQGTSDKTEVRLMIL